MTIADVLSGAANWAIDVGDVLAVLMSLPDRCIQCVVTSPPYWGLRDYGVAGQIGLEPTPAEYIRIVVEVFRQVRRVLRDDGTLWLNVGDTYSQDTKWGGYSGEINQRTADGGYRSARNLRTNSGCKAKELVGVPWRLAFALSDDGWYLRSELIWNKLAPMPESVNDRVTRAHEHVFLFSKEHQNFFLMTKKPKYFYDAVAIQERCSENTHSRGSGLNPKAVAGDRAVGTKQNASFAAATNGEVEFRNARSVWVLPPESYKGAHFAVMPKELARRCIQAGTSEHGACPGCGAPWRRKIKKMRVPTRPGRDSKVGKADAQNVETMGWNRPTAVGNRDPRRHITRTETVGWTATCRCGRTDTVPCLVLDPFAGAGTTLLVARRLGCRGVGIELNPEYAEQARQRIIDDFPLFNR